jgi:hypothetical protein
MRAIKDGGPAFPRAGFWSDGGPCATDTQPQGGMSLRDWFAGQALAGMLAGGFGDTVPHDDVGGGSDAAYFAFQYADAMIAARGEP